MVSIGELARRSGTTPRMLRHWEAVGLLPPADVDPCTGRRSYDSAQTGRAQTIAALRANGFGLDAIRDLRDSRSDLERVRAVLDARRSTLAASIARDTAALDRVERRLLSLRDVQDAADTAVRIEALPEVRGAGHRAIVTHESEIPAAVARLIARLAAPSGADIVLIYDGTNDAHRIAVSALTVGPGAAVDGAVALVLPAAASGAVLEFAQRPVDVGDAWMAVDGALAVRGLQAVGPYRQVVHARGGTTLSTPTRIVGGGEASTREGPGRQRGPEGA